MRPPACEFPNDNSALHDGAVWVCLNVTGMPRPVVRSARPPAHPVLPPWLTRAVDVADRAVERARESELPPPSTLEAGEISPVPPPVLRIDEDAAVPSVSEVRPGAESSALDESSDGAEADAPSEPSPLETASDTDSAELAVLVERTLEVAEDRTPTPLAPVEVESAFDEPAELITDEELDQLFRPEEPVLLPEPEPRVSEAAETFSDLVLDEIFADASEAPPIEPAPIVAIERVEPAPVPPLPLELEWQAHLAFELGSALERLCGGAPVSPSTEPLWTPLPEPLFDETVLAKPAIGIPALAEAWSAVLAETLGDAVVALARTERVSSGAACWDALPEPLFPESVMAPVPETTLREATPAPALELVERAHSVAPSEAAAETEPDPEPEETADDFSVLVDAVQAVVLGLGATRAAAAVPPLFLENRFEKASVDGATAERLVAAGLASDEGGLLPSAELIGTISGWRGVLTGESDDMSACTDTLDGFCTRLVAALAGVQGQDDEIRSSLRELGVAAFGIVAQAA